MSESDFNNQTATHDPLAITNYFIRFNSDKKAKKGLTLLQLLRLSYIAHGFKLALFGYPLAEQAVQAWKYGPVFSRIYNEFKRHGLQEIRDFATVLDKVTMTLVPASSKFSDEETRIIKIVYDIYGDIDGWRLSALTHKENTPWYAIRQKDKKERIYGSTIPNEKIKTYFKKEIIDKYT